MPTHAEIAATEGVITAETACLHCGAMVTTGRLYCSTKCGNAARMDRYKHRQVEAIRDRHYERIDLYKRLIRYELLDLYKEIHRMGLEGF